MIQNYLIRAKERIAKSCNTVHKHHDRWTKPIIVFVHRIRHWNIAFFDFLLHY